MHLPKIDGEHATGKVIGRKRTADGELVGKYHPDCNLDTRQYEVEYQDGTREAHLMNSIAAALHSELDDDGNAVPSTALLTTSVAKAARAGPKDGCLR